MDYEELRPLVLEALKTRFGAHLTIGLIINETDRIARSRGFLGNIKPWNADIDGTLKHYMERTDREKVRRIIWDLVVFQGILIIGKDENNPNFPYLSLTEFGKQVLESGQTLPYDPDGYLKKLKIEIPNLDQTIEDYVSESLQAFLKGLMFACAVMLGVASEKAFLILLETFTNALTNPTEKRRFQKLQECIKTKFKFEQMKTSLMRIKSTLPKELSDELEFQFDGIFNLIRLARNDAGHPTGRRIERDMALAYLLSFRIYCKKIYGLIDYFGSHPI